jgi:hypothetical protein
MVIVSHYNMVTFVASNGMDSIAEEGAVRRET